MTLRYLGRRLLQVVPVVAGIVLIGFMLLHVAPGDPVVALAGESGDAEYYAFMREKFGLDRPLPEQLVTYVGNLLKGDLGVSYLQGRPVVDLIGERVGGTLLLGAAALLISTPAGIALGVLAASRPGGVRDVAVTTGTVGLFAAPVFWVAQLALLVLALGAGLFPVQGMTSPGGAPPGFAGVLDVSRHLALPALVLASQEIAVVARLTRVGMLEELAGDHIRTARAKGLGEFVVMTRHALRRAMLPVLTVIGSRVGHLLSGAIVVEVVFGWPGLGRLLLTAMQTRDYPILLGIFLLIAFSVVLINLLTDLAYVRLDPRIAYR